MIFLTLVSKDIQAVVVSQMIFPGIDEIIQIPCIVQMAQRVTVLEADRCFRGRLPVNRFIFHIQASMSQYFLLVLVVPDKKNQGITHLGGFIFK
jgi:hypothetical protein